MSKKYVAVYPGRFHPFHSNHYETYENSIKQFGVDNVYIATSNKIEYPNSPFSFTEKKKIITGLYSIGSDKVVQIKNPYNPVEIFELVSSDYSYITIVGHKDGTRLLNRKYFELYIDGIDMKPYTEKGYLWIAPPNSCEMSSTSIRNFFKDHDYYYTKYFFELLYEKFDSEIFKMMDDKMKG